MEHCKSKAKAFFSSFHLIVYNLYVEQYYFDILINICYFSLQVFRMKWKFNMTLELNIHQMHSYCLLLFEHFEIIIAVSKQDFGL